MEVNQLEEAFLKLNKNRRLISHADHLETLAAASQILVALFNQEKPHLLNHIQFLEMIRSGLKELANNWVFAMDDT